MKFVFCGGVYVAKYTLRGESVFCPLQEGKTRGSERIFSFQRAVPFGMKFLKDHHASIPAGVERRLIPQAGLYLTDVAGADHQHAQTGLADTAADGQRQLTREQHLVERQLAALVAAARVVS